MLSNRRNFIANAAASAGVLAGVATVAKAAQSLKPISPVGPAPSVPRLSGPYSLSSAVVSAVATSANVVSSECAKGAVSSADLRELSTMLGVLYANLDEVGATPLMNAAMTKAGLFAQPLSYSQLAEVRTGLGVKVSDAVFERYVISTQTAFPDFRSTYLNGGLVALNQLVLDTIGGLASDIESQKLSMALRSGSLRRVNLPQPACEAIGAAGLYMSTWGYMLWVGAADFGPIGVGSLAMFSLAVSLVGYVGC